MGLGYLRQTWGDIGLGIVAIAYQNENYEMILKAIWSAFMISNLQF